jgi:hypothetical protein
MDVRITCSKDLVWKKTLSVTNWDNVAWILTFSEIIFRISFIPSVKSNLNHKMVWCSCYERPRKRKQFKENKRDKQSNLWLLHLGGLRNSGMAGPSRRGFGQRGWSLRPLEPSLFVSEPESTRLPFAAKWCILHNSLLPSSQNEDEKSKSQVKWNNNLLVTQQFNSSYLFIPHWNGN